MEQMEQQEHSRDFNVILAVDEGPDSEHAFKYYRTEIHKPGNKLHVIHNSQAWAKLHPMDGGPSPGHVQELKCKEDKKIKEIEDKYTNLMKENEIEGFFKVVGGKDSWHAVIDYQESVHGAMIVVGCRGLGTIKRTLRGSVSDDIVHHAHCPVLVCRHS